MKMFERINKWSQSKIEDDLCKKYGGIQWCPWCGQVMQLHGDWGFKEWAKDPMLDVLTCGPCGGTSLWRFEIGFLYIGPLDAPKPKHKPADYYDVNRAALK